jgi:predicted protein tyrosine phosphatase
MTMIIVTPLSAVEETIRRYRPSHMVTLLSPEHMILTPPGFAPERHLRLGVNDIADPAFGEAPPSERHVAEIIEFGRGWSGEAPMLIHCWAGISRSMAAAYMLLCDRTEPGREEEIARAIRSRAPHAFPNPLLVRLADAQLGREGRMVRGAEAIGRGRIVASGECVEFPLVLEEL